MKKPTGKQTSSDSVIKLNPVRYRLRAAPFFAHTDFHQSLATIRKLAPRDPQKEPQLDEAIKRYRERLPQEWQRRSKDFSFLGKNLSERKLQPFFRFLRDCGPRGLALMLADEEILKHVEGWWVESILGHAALRQNLTRIGEELARAGSRGRKKKVLPEEIKEDSLKRKRKYDVRVDSAEKKIRQAIEREYEGAFKKRPKMNSSRIDARKLREQIKDDVLARFSNSSDTAERRAAKKIKR